MRRVLPIFLLTALGLAGERALVEIRLEKEPRSTLYGWVLSYDRTGFRFQRLGGARKVWIDWQDLVADDAVALRRRFGLALQESAEIRRIPAHRLRFANGAVVEGLLLRTDSLDRHWVKTDGIVMPYPGDLITEIEEIELEETRVYDEQELYVRRLEENPPATAAEHADLAQYLDDIGNFANARRHYLAALESNPLLDTEVKPRLARIDEYLADEAAAAVFRKAKRRAFLDGDAPAGIAIVERYIEARPEVRRRGIKLIDEIRERAGARRARLFTRVKNQELDRAVNRYLVRRKPDLDEAMDWVMRSLGPELEARIRDRLRLSKEEYERLASNQAGGSPHWATYWSGTFVIAKRTRGGQTGKLKPDPDAWWYGYEDVEKRSTFLKALAAEKLDLFEVVQINTPACTRCGGRGQVQKLSFRSAGAAGKHEWLEVCPRCWGSRNDRAVGYR